MQDEQKRLKELEASIRSQVAAEEKAHKIVEKLVLEDEISEEFLLNSGNFITTSHYADVVEERMIAQKCGYPLCKNQLSQVPSQKYKISLRTNRVYDITERKSFCSNFCFKASKYFESQISDSPVWTRIGESLKTFVLLDIESSSSRAGAGNVLLGRDGEHENMSYEFKEDCHMNYDQNDFSRQSNNIQDQVSTTEINEYKTTDSSQNSLQEKNSTCNDKDSPQTASLLPSSSSTNDKKHESNAGKRQFTSKKEGRQDIRKESLSRETIVQSVQVVFQEWCTHSTMEYLGLTDKTESVFPDTETDSFTARAARFFHPAINVKDDSDSDPETEATSKITKEDVIIKERKSLDKNPVCILPPIDSKSQTTIRRRIVLEKLFRNLPDLLSEVKLTVGEISRDLTQLVHTFSLSSKNVALKPLQWKILALALIVILQQKNHLVSQAMESSSSEFDSLLDRLAITRQDIDQVLSPLSSFTPLGHYENLEQAAKTLESSEKQGDVFEERKDYGDMEELD